MRLSWVFRIGFLLALLMGVFFSIYHLKSKGINKDLFYLKESAQTENPTPVDSNDSASAKVALPEINLCKTRVQSINLTWNGAPYKIEIRGKSWQANEKTLPSVAIEKWLVLLCGVKAEKLVNLGTSTQKYLFKDQIIFNYVDGSSVSLGLDTPAFRIDEHVFYSKSLLEQMNDLKTLISSPASEK